jgi:serine/threonine-protein kinase
VAEVAEGTIVDGRYRIVRRLGSGGMADVYCAEDSQLGRQIALKMLHRRFSRDREFVERFRREASAAAGLQHPNVVGVFDRGEFDGTYYIAMEYLPGRTLKDLIRDEAPLSQERAIDMGIQILQAAAFAHRRGVIHRDFKPHNVIVGPDDRLKVTDFGIARAGSSEMTETGSIMGTAQYLSPEQAQGQRVGAPSDLYSIGVVLYEMLAARVPFTGESAVSIALKHVSEEPPPLRELRPDIHPRLEQAVGRALLKDPAQRYASGDEFIAALEAARQAIGSGDNGSGTGPFVPLEPERDPRGRRWPFVLLAVVLLLAALAAVALSQDWFSTEQKVVPKVTGQRATRATATLEKAGFEVKTHSVQSGKKAGLVVTQDPQARTEADVGSTIDLGVSSGPGKALVPSVSNLPAKQAQRDINGAGFRVTLDEQPSKTVKKGISIRTSPKEGALIPRGSEVRLIVSSGPPQVTVPSVVGETEASARSALANAGLNVTRALEDSADVPKGQVIAQDPGGGSTVDEGSTVTLTVSKGPKKVEVPDVVGQDKADARATLRDVGFTVRVVERESDEPEGSVIRQSPPGGGKATEGSQVTIFVAVPPADTGGAGPGGDTGDQGNGNGTGTGNGDGTTPPGGTP